MPGELSATPSLPFIEVLDAAERNRLDGLGLSDIRQSPFDTTFANDTGKYPRVMPPEVHDVREALPMPYVSPGWRDDTLVRGTISFRMNKVRNNLEAVAETVDPTNPHALPLVRAVFILGRIGLGEYPADELVQISMLGFRRLIADLRITNIRRQSEEPHVPQNHYGAIVGDIHAVERPFDGDYDALADREPVLVEGIVEAYEPGRQSEDLPRHFPGIIIRQADGQSVAARLLRTNELRYGGLTIGAGGSITEPIPPYPVPGDQAQVVAIHSRTAEGSSLILRDYYSAYLLGTSDERIYGSLAAQLRMDELLNQLRSISDPAKVRELIGKYVADLLSIKNGEVIFDLPASHREHLLRAVNAENPHTEAAMKAQPMALQLQKDAAYYLMQAFGKEILMLSPAEFSLFLLEVARGERLVVNLEAGLHVYQFCRYNKRMQAMNFVTATLGDFFDRYTMERLVKLEKTDRDEYARFMVMRAIETLQDIQNQDKIAGALIKLTLDTFGDDPAIPDLRDVLPAALLQSLVRCGSWDFNLFSCYSDGDVRRGKPRSIVYSNAYQAYLEAAPAIIGAIHRVNQTTIYYDAAGKLRTEYGHFLELFIQTLDKLSVVASG